MSRSRGNLSVNVTLPMSTSEYWSSPCEGENFTNMKKIDDLVARGLHLTPDEYGNVDDLKKTLERRTNIPAHSWQVRDEHGRKVKKTTPGGRYSASPVNPNEDSQDEDSDAEAKALCHMYEDSLRLQDSSHEDLATCED
ncbi:uncharacterized protein [Ptychodera flava]|uniref:uncharacterized protein isoform X2 n=1 Tax=Ptychodera flava TaxID=63121 RepID=UPI00396A775B